MIREGANTLRLCVIDVDFVLIFLTLVLKLEGCILHLKFLQLFLHLLHLLWIDLSTLHRLFETFRNLVCSRPILGTGDEITSNRHQLRPDLDRSEEHTSELQSLMRI